MSIADWIVFGLLWGLIAVTLFWAYRKRHRLFNNAQFTAETCYRYFQTADKQQAIDAMLYQNDGKKSTTLKKKVIPFHL